ncbi:hypothetical protein ASZ90_012242 [hydrocarbon metagenome]|uniref:Uncharacterized protein n=1 Tax=hydrocarbon metagenome TaxID=938273 RepID=A0A0W8FB10_9ZZZZ
MGRTRGDNSKNLGGNRGRPHIWGMDEDPAFAPGDPVIHTGFIQTKGYIAL